MPGPRPCLVLGCGRSGTSLAAGLLADSGYDLGPHLLAADPSNPKGYFESRVVNALNEDLLAPLATGPVLDADGAPASDRPLRAGERWLATLPPDMTSPRVASPERAGELRAAAAPGASGRPVARKDPRFAWTLPAWDDALPGAARVCVFREPLRTARSILRMTDTGDLGLTPAGALGVWAATYRRCLALADGERARDWVFVHYDQLVSGAALDRLGALLGARLTPSFADPQLRRSPDDGEVPGAVAAVLAELEARARR